MGCIAGRLAGFKVSPDNGATFLPLGGIVDQSLTGNVDELECTSHDSGGVREYVPNFFDATAELEMRWDEDDLGQVFIESTLFPTPTTFKVQFYMENKSGRRRYDADAFLTNFSPSGPLDDTASLSVSMRLSGIVATTTP